LLAGLGLLVIVFFWRVLIPGSGERARFVAGDFSHIFYPARYYVAQSLAAGQLPLWNPHVASGYPHFADPQAATFYPFSLITAVLTRGALSLSALQLEAVGHYFLAAAFIYLFARYLLQDPGAAFGGYLTGYPALQLSELEAGVWLPLALLLATLAVDRRSARWAALTGAPLALVFLAGRPQSYLSIIPLTVGWLLYRGRRAGRSWRELLVYLGLTLLFTLGLAAVQMAPTLELSRLSTRADFSWASAAEGGFDLWELGGIVAPRLAGSFPLYAGLVTLLLVGVAVAGPVEAGQWLFWLVAALIALFVSLGKHTALFDVIYLVQRVVSPGYLRNLERLALAFSFSMAMLAAYGVKALTTETARAIRRPVLVALALLGLAVAVAYGGRALAVAGSSELAAYNRLLDNLLFIGLLLGATYLGLAFLAHRPRGCQAILAGLVALDLLTVNAGRLYDPWSGNPLSDLDIVAPLREVPGIFRVQSDGLGFPDYGNFLGLENVNSAAPLQVSYYQRFLREVDELRRLALLNVHVLATKREISHQAFQLLYERDGVRVYAFFGQNPRAYLAPTVLVAGNDDEAASALRRPDFAPGTMAVVLGQPPPVSDSALDAEEQVEVEQRQPTRTLLRVRSQAARLLVYGDVFYPGWHALVDGVPTPIYRANLALRAVVVPPGEHVVTFIYRPLSLYIGAGTTALAVLVLLVWFVWREPRMSRKARIELSIAEGL
jgi:hypothetical protein